MPARLLSACLLAILIGCGKPPASAPSPPPVAPRADSPAAAGAAAAAPTTADEAPSAAVLNELTQVVRKYGVEQRRVPKNLEELVAGGYLSRVPQAPAGKRFAINKDLQVYLANR